MRPGQNTPHRYGGASHASSRCILDVSTQQDQSFRSTMSNTNKHDRIGKKRQHRSERSLKIYHTSIPMFFQHPQETPSKNCRRPTTILQSHIRRKGHPQLPIEAMGDEGEPMGPWRSTRVSEFSDLSKIMTRPLDVIECGQDNKMR